MCECVGERAMGGSDEGAKEGEQEERREETRKERGTHIVLVAMPREHSRIIARPLQRSFSGVWIALKRAVGVSIGSRRRERTWSLAGEREEKEGGEEGGARGKVRGK